MQFADVFFWLILLVLAPIGMLFSMCLCPCVSHFTQNVKGKKSFHATTTRHPFGKQQSRKYLTSKLIHLHIERVRQPSHHRQHIYRSMMMMFYYSLYYNFSFKLIFTYKLVLFITELVGSEINSYTFRFRFRYRYSRSAHEMLLLPIHTTN